MRVLLLTIAVFTNLFAFSQTANQIEIMDSSTYLAKLDSFKLKLSENKTVISEYELATFIALSYYPELIDSRISFKKAKIKTTLNARPSVGSLLFCSKKDRNYVIRINQKTKDSVISFDAIPFNAKVGLLGHEFGHILDYQDKTIGQVIKRLFAYSTKKSKAKFEKEIDAITIKKGLGWQLHAWADYVLNHSNATIKYKAFKQETYLTPVEISDLIGNHQ